MAAFRQKSRRRQHLAERTRGVRKAGSFGLAVLLSPPSFFEKETLIYYSVRSGMIKIKIKINDKN